MLGNWHLRSLPIKPVPATNSGWVTPPTLRPPAREFKPVRRAASVQQILAVCREDRSAQQLVQVRECAVEIGVALLEELALTPRAHAAA